MFPAYSFVQLTARHRGFSSTRVVREWQPGTLFEVLPDQPAAGHVRCRHRNGCVMLLPAGKLAVAGGPPDAPTDDPPHDGDHPDGGPVGELARERTSARAA